MKTKKITQEEIGLIKSVQAGSERAFAQLFKRYKPFVENLLTTYLNDRDEARDLTNIVFLKVHEKISKFTNYSTFGGWLRILTKNVAIDYLRTIKPVYSLQESITSKSIDVAGGDTEREYVDRMTYDKVIAMFSKLPPSYRDVCYMFYVDNMTVQQISEALNMPTGTIKSDLHRMRKILQTRLKIDRHVKPRITNNRRSHSNRDRPIQQEP